MELWELGAAEAARKIAGREITSAALVQACLDRVSDRDADVGAWIWLEPERALEQARAADRAIAEGVAPGLLHGVPIGVKDIIETADMPTQNGYAPHQGRRTGRDADCVAQLRAAGAVIMGKTVTTELAARTPGKTRNPVNPAYTPGGSSSGSAAAVRDGQVPLALGTQTGGSVIRPASFCGIHALKPTFGRIPRDGVTVQADFLDTVGTYGRSFEDVALITDAMPSDPSVDALTAIAMSEPAERPKIAFARGGMWHKADPDAQSAFEAFASVLGDLVEEIELPSWMNEAWSWQDTLQRFGNAIHYGPLADAHGEAMSQSLRNSVAAGRNLSQTAYDHALAQRDRVHDALLEIYGRYDAILCLASPGPAPAGLDWTGDPVFNAFWTYVGTPCVTIPLLEVRDLPMGVQLTGPRGGDGALLRTARWLERLATGG